MEIKDSFFELYSHTELPAEEIHSFWEEITGSYNDKNRHYHTLEHLQQLLNELSEVKENIGDWNTIMFTLFYHDIVYSSFSYKNELKSAELAGERMRKAGVSEERIEKCQDQILATKYHRVSEEPDTNYFLDADLSILGYPEKIYREYTKNIRQEFKLLPKGIFRKGRKKVIENFLSMDSIYKTKYFYDKYENQARANLTSEIKQLE